MNSGIYVITSPSGKAYIGSSRRLSFRKSRHFYEMRRGTHHCEKLQHAWNKYGEQLTFVVIERCDEELLLIREQWWMDHRLVFWKGAYNTTLIAERGGTSPTPETRARISAATKGRKLTEEHKQKLRKPKSAEHAAAISRANRGVKKRPCSDADKARKRIETLKTWADPEIRAKRLAGSNKAWNDERREKQVAAFARRRLRLHVEMLEWIIAPELAA